MKRGLQQQYTDIVRTALLRISDDACQAQHALAPAELERLELEDIAQLCCDAQRALRNTRIASAAVLQVLKIVATAKMAVKARER